MNPSGPWGRGGPGSMPPRYGPGFNQVPPPGQGGNYPPRYPNQDFQPRQPQFRHRGPGLQNQWRPRPDQFASQHRQPFRHPRSQNPNYPPPRHEQGFRGRGRGRGRGHYSGHSGHGQGAAHGYFKPTMLEDPWASLMTDSDRTAEREWRQWRSNQNSDPTSCDDSS